ncbi:NifB/NifX family molybdenum-iron cluster-binding protein [Thermodesulfobacteriota bacterium]
MKIAIPNWEDVISPVLDTASMLLVVEVEGTGDEISRIQIHLDEQNLVKRCLRIQGLGINILICGAVSRSFLTMLEAAGIDVIPEISGRTEEILEAYMHGQLFHSRFLMPGCKRTRLRHGRKNYETIKINSIKT